jgi:hypothetical protein
MKKSNAAHHAPARKIEFDDIPRVAGRVHALVMLPMLREQLVVLSVRADPEPHNPFGPIEA